MSRPLFLGIIIYALLIAGMGTVTGGMFTLMLPLVVYLLAGHWFAPDALELEANRQLSAERAAPNSDIQVVVTIKNRGSSLEEVLVEDLLPEGLTIRLGHHRHLIRLPKGGTYTFTYTVTGPRGGYGFEKVQAKVHDHLGVTRREVQMEARGQLFIFPPVMRLRHVVIRPRRTRVYAGQVPAKAGGSGSEFFGVREYQPGDPPRTINWRASAHSLENLYSNEYQQERVADVGIVLDGRLRSNEFAHGHSLFEYSVQAAAALADALLTQGNRVGLLVYATFLRWTVPGYGKVQRERILQSLAHAKPGGSQVFSELDHIPTRLFPPESQIVLVSPLLEDDLQPLLQMRAQGYQVLVVCPDPVSFELAYLHKDRSVELASRIINLERAILLQKVRRAGVQVLDWTVSEPFDLVVKRKLSRPPAWLRAVGR